MGAAKAPVRVQAVVKGLAMNAEDVCLQVAFLGGTVGAVSALEGLQGWRRREKDREKGFSGELEPGFEDLVKKYNSEHQPQTLGQLFQFIFVVK